MRSSASDHVVANCSNLVFYSVFYRQSVQIHKKTEDKKTDVCMLPCGRKTYVAADEHRSSQTALQKGGTHREKKRCPQTVSCIQTTDRQMSSGCTVWKTHIQKQKSP